MPTYYTWHKDLEVTAEVNAPDTRHARTSYLDYLSRKGFISWRDRQSIRKGVKATKVEPGEVQASVTLDYDFKTPEVQLPKALPFRPGGAVEEPTEIPEIEPVEAPEVEEAPRGLGIEQIYGRSPIMEASRRMGGL